LIEKIKNHLIEVFAAMFLLLFLFWSIGYFANGLFGAKFDLASCWGGFAALGGSGTLAAVKYIYDSKYNTAEGEKP
jgi:hypothetical protein